MIAMEAKAYCRKHGRMGEWKRQLFQEHLGGGVYSLVDDCWYVVCEDCS